LTLEDFIACHDRVELEAAIRARCQNVAVDPQTILCRILGRYKFFLDCRDQGLAPHLMLDGYWEYWVSDFIWRNVKPGETVADVGANLGYYTVLLADLVGPGGRVVALEPNPRLFDLLQRNVAINGFSRWTDCHAKAVAAKSGEWLNFRALVTDPKNGALLPASDRQLDPDHIELAVETQAFDDLSVGPINFLKIDVEGAEEALWTGLQQTIARNPNIKILLEFNSFRCRTPERMIAEMAELFPLRKLDYDAVVRGTDAAHLLQNPEDTMLYLSRTDPVDFSTPPSF
jgi:FkbM family methyltransferase